MKIVPNANPTPLQPMEPERHENPALKKVAKDFEAVFINQMVGAMRKTVVKGGMIPETNAERIYQSMLDQQHAERISDAEQIGLSNIIYEHLLRTSGGG